MPTEKNILSGKDKKKSSSPAECRQCLYNDDASVPGNTYARAKRE